MRKALKPGTQTRRKNNSLQHDTSEGTEINLLRIAVETKRKYELRLIRPLLHCLRDEVVRADLNDRH
jgi:hypothetical protein